MEIYSSHYQQIIWEGFGLKLHIHKGCLPAGMEQCIVHIKASLAGQYEFPGNSQLVSAIFWIRCDAVHKFLRPITVEIQHCARLENVTSLNLTFVRAVCSQKHLPYTFKQIGGEFTSHSSYGIIELNRFSGIGITQEGSEDREYCSRLFYLGQEMITIYFIVVWNTEVHLNVSCNLQFCVIKLNMKQSLSLWKSIMLARELYQVLIKLLILKGKKLNWTYR